MKMTNFETLIEKRMMKKKIMIVLVSAFLLLSAFSCGGGNKANSTSEQNEKIVVNVPQFDADSAYLYVKNQVDFGPRVPNTKGHVACGNYLAKQLKDFGAQVTDQYADLIAYNGTLLKARNIIGSYKPESKKYPRCIDYGSHDRLCGRRHYPDTAISEFCRTVENVHALVNGFSRTHHHYPTGNHDAYVMPGTAHFHSLHQTVEPVASWRKLCTDNGNEHQAFTYTHLHLHRAADRNGDRILRPGRFYRVGSAACHTVAVQQRRPPDTCPRHYADGTYQHASLRHHRQEIPASGELYHRLARCSGHFMGNS